MRHAVIEAINDKNSKLYKTSLENLITKIDTHVEIVDIEIMQNQYIWPVTNILLEIYGKLIELKANELHIETLLNQDLD